MAHPRKLILHSYQSPGDVVMLTSTVRDLHKLNPGRFLTDVRTSTPALWENNPHVTPIADSDPDATTIKCEYPAIHQCGERPIHFIHAYHEHLSNALTALLKEPVPIYPTLPHGDMHLSAEEKGWIPQVQGEYWIIDAGHKTDFTAKMWEFARFQQVVDEMKEDVKFVQIGEAGHNHEPLVGVTNLIGKTDHRQFGRLMYHARGVITPVSYPMHLSAAIPDKRTGGVRPCVVLGGGREPRRWEAYDGHVFFDAIGKFQCCKTSGCWKSRVIPLGDGDPKDHSLCLMPMTTESKQVIPKCLAMISVLDVVTAVRDYMDSPVYQGQQLAQLPPYAPTTPVAATIDDTRVSRLEQQTKALWEAYNVTLRGNTEVVSAQEVRIRAVEKRLADMFDEGEPVLDIAHPSGSSRDDGWTALLTKSPMDGIEFVSEIIIGLFG